MSTAASPLRAPPWHRRFALGIVAVSVVAALLAMLGVGVLGTLAAEEQLADARRAKAAAVAHAVQRDLALALDHGIPLDRVEGMTAYLEGIAARNPDLHALAVTGAGGRTLYAAGPGAGDADGAGAVRLPLRAGADAVGHVLVAVDSGRIRAQLVGELAGLGLGMAGVLLLVAELAGALVQAAVRAPLDRLSRVMAAAAGGDFRTLIARRPRDQIGRALLAFNAAVFHLHDRRQRFAAHAEEVRSAVFDPAIAAEVERARARTLDALGDGAAVPPQRVVDPRPGDARAGAALLSAAAVMGCLGAVPTLAEAGGMLAGLAAGLAAAWVVRPAWTRAAVAGAALLVGAGSLLGVGALAAVGGGVGLALAWRYARAAGEGGGAALRPVLTGAAAAALWIAGTGWDGGVVEGAVLAALALPATLPLVRR